MKTDNTPYIGNGAYCYANSTSMLLASVGEKVSPSLIEVLTGVGLSASLKRKNGFLFFNHQSLSADLGVTKALKILGFKYKLIVFDKAEDDPYRQLKKDLEQSSAVLGPLNMFYLTYNPEHQYLKGADHFVFAYKIEDQKVYLHDPAGFPHVFISISNLKKAWQARGIFYKKGFYRYITKPKRIEKPSQNNIYQRALTYFQSIYRREGQKTNSNIRLIGKEAVFKVAERVKRGHLSNNEWKHFIYFALPLGAKRALDFALFFNYKDKNLANLKYQQAEVFGQAYTYTIAKNWPSLSETLRKLGNLEQKFQDLLLAVN